jgi:hypothetical protein
MAFISRVTERPPLYILGQIAQIAIPRNFEGRVSEGTEPDIGPITVILRDQVDDSAAAYY